MAWSSFIQVESKILEKQGASSVGSREAFRKKTSSVFVAAVVLFGISVAAFVYSFSIIGYIKPCQHARALQVHTTSPNRIISNALLIFCCQGLQVADAVEIDTIKSHLLGALPAGSKGLVNRLANREHSHLRERLLGIIVCLQRTGWSCGWRASI